MKNHKTRNSLLALAGLASLCVYILACTSFSPDDSQVLYPVLDPDTGATGLAVYARETRRSETVFLPLAYDSGQSNTWTPGPVISRAQWLADGHRILIASPETKGKDDGLSLTLLPWKERLPIKVFHLAEWKDATPSLLLPLCVVGEHLFLNSSGMDVPRIDLKSGTITHRLLPGDAKEVVLLPSPDEKEVFYLESFDAPDTKTVLGRLNPDSFEQTPLLVLTNESLGHGLFACYPRGPRLALLESEGETNRLRVFQPGKAPRLRALGGPGEKEIFSSLGFFPKGDRLWATFMKRAAGAKTVTCGFIEIPLDESPVRETALFTLAQAKDGDNACLFQGAVSHDGRTAAVASTYLACDNEAFDPANCALFLVDLKDPARKITKVPVPMPKRSTSSEGK